MLLKKYQTRVLKDLDLFLINLDELNDIARAYATTWLENGVAIGEDGMPPYKDNISGVPHICFKVPTGGGKTVMACSSLKHIYDALERWMAGPMKEKIVVWLVPSNAILEQTLKALRDPNHPYRQLIDGDFNARVEVLDGIQARNGQNFTPATVRENLTIIVMSFDSLRVRNKEGRKAYQENGNLDSFVVTYEHPETMIADAEENALMQVLNQKNPVVIIDESHNAQSDLSVETLKNLNPSFVLDLTATPRSNSNIISIVDASELKREDMVKLPIIVYNRSSLDDVIDDAIILRANLEEKAKAAQAAGAGYIRPIVLFQAQPRLGENTANFSVLKAMLIECGIPEKEIAIKTSEINDIKDVDLSSPECPIRYIITVNALKEGWDCPFAYVLATVANRSSRVDVEQIVGRILRLPYTRRSPESTLNMSYILTSSADFSETVHSVIKGLNQAGFTERDFRAQDTSERPSVEVPVEYVVQPVVNSQVVVSFTDEGHTSDANRTESSADTSIDYEFDPQTIRDQLQQYQNGGAATQVNDSVTEMLRTAEIRNEEYNRLSQGSGAAAPPIGGDEMRRRFEMRSEFEDDAKSLVLPQFVMDFGPSLFSDHDTGLVSKEALSEGFTLSDKDTEISFVMSDYDMAKVDIDSGSKPRSIALREREALRFKEFIHNEPPEFKRSTLSYNIYKKMNRLDYIASEDLKEYIFRIVNNMSDEELEKAEDALPFYADRIKSKILDLTDEYREKNFFRQIETGAIMVEPTWEFPAKISPVPTMSPLDKALYTDEGTVNRFEERVITFISTLQNVRWWHRNVERQGFCLNGFINHYPDFIIRTTRGNVILLETKGDDRDNSDSRKKLRLGTKWASMAGNNYKYYMVFDETDFGLDGAYKLSEFSALLKEL